MRSIATSANTAKAQSVLISDFASNNGLTLNMSKMEAVKISRNPTLNKETVNLSNISVPITSQAKCLGYMCSKSLSARAAVENNIARACRQCFALGSTGCYLGHSNPLSARIVVETCVMPTLLYGAENWILDDTSLNLLEKFQEEKGRRILRLKVSLSVLCPPSHVLALNGSQNSQTQAWILIPSCYPLRMITLPQAHSALLLHKMCTILGLYNKFNNVSCFIPK